LSEGFVVPDSTSAHLPRIVAVTNQKGGVGKTTTAINLAAAMAEQGLTVLLIDLDPQGNASTGLGIEPARRTRTTYDVMIDGLDLASVIQKTGQDRIWLCPATTDLSSIDMEIGSDPDRIQRLRRSLSRSSLAEMGVNLVLIDCPPSLSLLTVNAMVAADAALVPLQAEFFALEGLSQLLLTVRDVRSGPNPALRIEGVLLTMYDRRNNLSQQVERDARQALGDLVFRTVIPRNVRVSEAPSHALPVLQYDSTSAGALAYRALAEEIRQRHLPAAHPEHHHD
jgi:chromosome partitioning protein